MNKWIAGLVAGLIATIVLSVLLLLKGMMGVMPELNAIKGNMAIVGSQSMAVGWLIHALIGIVLWGLIFAAIGEKLPGPNYAVKGIVMGIIAWLLMMIVWAPLAGAGFFAANIGVMAAVATLILHIIYGVVLGPTYAKLAPAAGPSKPGSAGGSSQSGGGQSS